MKKILLFLVAAIAAQVACAQIMRAKELEAYAKENFGSDWKTAAANLSSKLKLDKNNALTFSEIIEAEGMSKSDLFVRLNYWYTSTFNDANSVIQLNDKESGVIIGKGYVSEIADHAAGLNAYKININPIIKTDIKDGKVRVTYTVQAYDVDKLAGGGVTAAALAGPNRQVAHLDETWPLDTCYPFAPKDKHMKTSSKAIVMTYAYSNVIMDKIKEAIQHGMTEADSEEW